MGSVDEETKERYNDEKFDFSIKDQSIRNYFSHVDPFLASPKKEEDDLTRATFFTDSLIKYITLAEGELYINSDKEITASYYIKENKNIESYTIEEMEAEKSLPPSQASEFPGGVYYLQAKEEYTQHTNSHLPP